MPTLPALSVRGLNLSALAVALRRNWSLVLLATVATAGLTAGLTALQTRIYQSTSVVLVTPTARSGASGMMPGIAQYLAIRGIVNEVELLRQSDVLAERVASQLLERDSLVGTSDPDLEARVRRLRGQVSFAPISNQVDMIRIVATSPDAREAARIANAYAEQYRLRGREMMRSSATGSRAFLQDQEAKRRSELAEVEADIEGYLSRAGAVDLDTETQAAVGSAASLDAEVEQTTVELETARAQLTSIRRQLAAVEPNLQAGVASSADREIDALQNQIAQLEVQAADYYAEDPTLRGDEGRNPDLAVLRRRIDEMTARVDLLSSRYVDEVTAVGGASGTDGSGLAFAGQLRRDASQAEILVQSLQAQLGALQSRRAGVAARLDRLPAQTIRLAQLRRQQQAGEQAYQFVVSRLQEARLAEESEPGYVEIVRDADVARWPIAPKPRQNVLLGILLGLGLGVGLALARFVADRRLRSAADVEENGRLVLASVPDFTPFVRDKMAGADSVQVGFYNLDPIVAAGLHPFSPVTEAFRRVRTAVKFSAPDRQIRTLLVTSPSEGEGKSTVATGLALSFAQAGDRVLYIDADLRRPTGHVRLGLGGRAGLTDLLFDPVEAEAIDWDRYRQLVRPDWEYAADIEDFSSLGAGRPVPNPTELLGSNRMRDVLQAASAAFDIVVVDSAPTLPVPDSIHLADSCDAVVLVVCSGSTTGPALNRATGLLETTNGQQEKMLGVVLNMAPDETEDGQASYGYGYGYGYGLDADFEYRWEATAAQGDGTSQARPALTPPEGS